MSIASLLNIGVTGLNANQKALRVAGHNIANVNTPGYSRQQVELGTYPEMWRGDGFFGSGVQVTGVRRIYDRFQVEQLRADTATTGQLRTYRELAGRLEDLFGGEATGVARPLQEFYDALSEVAADPASIGARQVLLGRAEALAERFQAMDARLKEMRGDVQRRIGDRVAEINSLTGSIAELNREIVSRQLGQGDPNDLLDRRDVLIERLSGLVAVTTVDQGDGTVNVFVGSGQNLVLGTRAIPLEVSPSPADPQRVEISMSYPGGAVPITDELRGGTLTGLLEFDRGLLAETEAGLGGLALGVGMAVNRLHAQGMDLTGAIGGALFTAFNDPALRESRVAANEHNTGNAVLGLFVDDPGALGTSDYRLSYDGAQYTLTRTGDETVVDTFAGFPHTVASEGFTIELESGAPAAGDSFLIRPTAAAAREMRVLLRDPESFAAAIPVRVESDPSNTGDLLVDAVSAEQLSGVPLSAPVTLTYDAGAAAFIVSNPPGGTLAYDPATDAGQPLALSLPGFGQVNLTLQGTPAAGDRLVIADNAGATGDNRNALALAALRNSPLFNGGTATPGEAYGRLVSGLGAKTESAGLALEAQETLLRRAQEARDATSGVNLDEEAADLLRFQQAYEASAQVIAAANRMFQTLISAFGG